jgi:hypothetical protein
MADAHYTLGRLLGLASFARDPKLWQVPTTEIVARLVEIADEYEAAREQTPHPSTDFSLFIEQQLAGGA